MFLVCCQFILKSISIHVSLSESSLYICIGGQSNSYNNTRKNIENIAVSAVIRSVILSFNVFAAASPTLYYHFEPKFYVNFCQSEEFLNCNIHHTS